MHEPPARKVSILEASLIGTSVWPLGLHRGCCRDCCTPDRWMQRVRRNQRLLSHILVVMVTLLLLRWLPLLLAAAPGSPNVHEWQRMHAGIPCMIACHN